MKMKSKDLEKIIDNSCQEEKKAIFDDLKKVFDFLNDDLSSPAENQSVALAAQKPASKWRVFIKKPARLAACVSLATAVICLAIILPFTLNDGGDLQAQTPPQIQSPPSITEKPSTSDDRFCQAATCKKIELNYTIKEYSVLKNLSFLHVDWYDVADIKTSMYVDGEDTNNVIYYQEILEHRYTGSIVELYITKARTSVDEIEDYKEVCSYGYVVTRVDNRVRVWWGYGAVENGEPNTYVAFFQYGSSVYTLLLRYPVSDTDIFELIDSMIPVPPTRPK